MMRDSTKGNQMNKKRIIVSNLAIFTVMVGLGALYQHRLDKQLKAGYAEMQKPLPPIGKEYLKRHRAFFNSPEVKAQNDVIDRFMSDHPELNL